MVELSSPQSNETGRNRAKLSNPGNTSEPDIRLNELSNPENTSEPYSGLNELSKSGSTCKLEPDIRRKHSLYSHLGEFPPGTLTELSTTVQGNRSQVDYQFWFFVR